jgi:hypothetical protein
MINVGSSMLILTSIRFTRAQEDLTHVLFFIQIALYESILASPHRTLNGDEADYFYVPVLDSCLITRSDDAPHLLMPVTIIIHILYFGC